MTEEEYYEIHEVCYVCGARGRLPIFWDDAIELEDLCICIECANRHDVEIIDDLPLVPVPTREWYL